MPPPPPSMTDDQRQRLLRKFHQLDDNGDGRLSMREIERVVCNSGLPKSKAEEFMYQFDLDGDGIVTLKEFSIALGLDPPPEDLFPNISLKHKNLLMSSQCLFHDLPYDIFARLFYYLSPNDALSLKFVCIHISSYLSTSLWRIRQQQRCSPSCYPCFPNLPLSNQEWISANLFFDKYTRLFRQDSLAASLPQPLITCCGYIEVIHATQEVKERRDFLTFVLAGDRGRTLTLVSAAKPVDQSCQKSFVDGKTHKGWIWSIDSCDRQVVTGSWDHKFRHFKLSDSTLDLQREYAYIDANICLIGTHNNHTQLVDLRAPETQGQASCIESPDGPDRTVLSILSTRRSSDNSDDDTRWSLQDVNSNTCHRTKTTNLGPWQSTNQNGTGDNSSSVDGPHSALSWSISQAWMEEEGTDGSRMPTKCYHDFFTACHNGHVYTWDLRKLKHPTASCKTNRIPGWDRGFGGLSANQDCLVASGFGGASVAAFHPTLPLKCVHSQPLDFGQSVSPTDVCLVNDSLFVGTQTGVIYVWNAQTDQ